MPTIDMQDTNRRAIVALDAGDIFHAERLFARNYRAHPCLMTALNYANFLGDCHHLSGQGIAAELVQRQRLTKSRKLLEHCLAEALLARMYAASFAREVPAFSDDALIACHFIGCPIHGEGAE